MLNVDTVRELCDWLLRLEEEPTAPRLDAEWLRLRCQDTLRHSGERQRASLRQLGQDTVKFDDEFPSVLPTWLAGDVASLRREYQA